MEHHKSGKCGCDSAPHARAHTRDGITASGVLSAEQIGTRQSITPEGFLLCEEVPIARVGSQDYAYFELPTLEAKDGVIVAERTADVLFSAETLASFEGKPVTIDHPPDFVTPANYMSVARGTVRNVRRGEGAQADLMLADLLITDAEAIRRVQSKGADALTQVSNGYDAEYEQIAPGRARQATIVGNHVALVKNARCGPVCSIGDSLSNLLPTGDFSMATKKPEQSTLLAKLRKAFMTRDSDAFEQVANEMTGDEDEAGSGLPQIHIHVPGSGTPPAGATGDADSPAGDPPAGPMAEVLTALKGLTDAVTAIADRVTKLEAGTTTADADPGGDADDDPSKTGDADPDDDAGQMKTGDSTAFRDEFQDAMSRAEILAPGVKLPTFDSKATAKKTSDSLCVLRRRALRAAGDSDNAGLVKSITGGQDISQMTCDSVKTMFMAASEVVKQKNLLTANSHKTQTNDGGGENWAEAQNKRNADFWANRK
ncbi:DUF2213 domain-containing protein [Cupriavidus sp. SZY C1]|uniref:DUF2213 domain-containing protein n=1 Tax=Cupriavidus sp. SZY C1 TaxID=3055037 RepID=UPI0028B42373|nr:DUF2213 domain-containing protein [Cupriavidus sp. SZY C1]MDT6962919.1 DUF2213 domain-containing protein [Cupriavidus sp. SZY C1]